MNVTGKLVDIKDLGGKNLTTISLSEEELIKQLTSFTLYGRTFAEIKKVIDFARQHSEKPSPCWQGTKIPCDNSPCFDCNPFGTAINYKPLPPQPKAIYPCCDIYGKDCPIHSQPKLEVPKYTKIEIFTAIKDLMIAELDNLRQEKER